MAEEGGLNEYELDEVREELVDFEGSEYEFENDEDGETEYEVAGDGDGEAAREQVLVKGSGKGGGIEEATGGGASAAATTQETEDEGLSSHHIRDPNQDDESQPSSPTGRLGSVSDGDEEGIGVYVAGGFVADCAEGGESKVVGHQNDGGCPVEVNGEHSASEDGRRENALIAAESSPGRSSSSGLDREKNSSEEGDDVANTMQLESLGGTRESASLAGAGSVVADGEDKSVDVTQNTEVTENVNVKGVECEDGVATGSKGDAKNVDDNKHDNNNNAGDANDGDDDEDDDDEEAAERRGRKRRKGRFAAERKIEAEDLEREEQHALAATSRMKRARGTKWDTALEANINFGSAGGGAGMAAAGGEVHGRVTMGMGRGIMGPGRPPAQIGNMGRGAALQGFMSAGGPGGHPLRSFEPGFQNGQFEMQEMMAQQRLMANSKHAEMTLQLGRGGGRGIGAAGAQFVGMASALGPVPGGQRPGGFEMFGPGPGIPPRGMPGGFPRPGLVQEQMMGMGPGPFNFLGPGSGPFPMGMSPRGMGMRPGAPFPGMMDGQWMGGVAGKGPAEKSRIPGVMGWEDPNPPVVSSASNAGKGGNRNFNDATSAGGGGLISGLNSNMQNRTDMQRRADIERHGGGPQRRNDVGRPGEAGRVEVGSRGESRRAELGRNDLHMRDLSRVDMGRADLGRMDMSNNRFDMARVGMGRSDFEMGRNDGGRADMGRNEFGRPEMRKSDMGRSDLMRADMGRGAESLRGEYGGRGELQRLGMGMGDAMGRLDMRMVDAERIQSGRGGEYGMRMSDMNSGGAGAGGGDRKGSGGTGSAGVSGSSRNALRQERMSENGKAHGGGSARHLATGSNLIHLGGPVTKSRTLVVSNIGKELKGAAIMKTFATSGDVTNVSRMPNGNLLVQYSSVAKAVAAKRHFHRTIVGGNEITVEYAVDSSV